MKMKELGKNLAVVQSIETCSAVISCFCVLFSFLRLTELVDEGAGMLPISNLVCYKDHCDNRHRS